MLGTPLASNLAMAAQTFRCPRRNDRRRSGDWACYVFLDVILPACKRSQQQCIGQMSLLMSLLGDCGNSLRRRSGVICGPIQSPAAQQCRVIPSACVRRVNPCATWQVRAKQKPDVVHGGLRYLVPGHSNAAVATGFPLIVLHAPDKLVAYV